MRIGFLRSMEFTIEVEDHELNVVLMSGYFSITFCDWGLLAYGRANDIKNTFFPTLTNLLSCLINSRGFIINMILFSFWPIIASSISNSNFVSYISSVF